MNKNIKNLLFPFITFPLLTGCNGNADTSVDFALLRNNYKAMLKDSTNIKHFKDKSKEDIFNEFDTVNISGVDTFKFKKEIIDYDAECSRSYYPLRNHLDYALELAIIAENNNDEDLKDAVRKLEYYWVFNNYKSPNWYENEIGTIRSLTNVAMFQYDELNDKGKEAFKGKVRNASIYYHPGLEEHQGANLMDYALNTFKSGILAKDKNETDCAFNRLMDEIKEDNTEGFQSEGSYFQHGRLLSTGSYGNVATSKIGEFFTTLKGSNYVVPQAKLKIILNCILVGLKYMMQREYRNWMCEGRSFCEKNNYKYATTAIKRYLDIDGISDEDKENLKTFITNHDEGKPCFNDIKVFPKARTIVSNVNGVYIAFKGCDPTTVNTECLNNENELAYNFSYGMNTSIMQSGLEYVNLSPVCDFSFLPGGVSKDYGFKDIEDEKFYKLGDKAIFELVEKLGNERYEDKVSNNDGDIYGMGDELDSNGVACCFQKGKHSNKTYGGETFNGQTFTVSCFSTKDGMAILGSNMVDLDNTNKDARYVTLQQCTLNEGDIASTTGEDYDFVSHNYKNEKKDIDTKAIYKSLNGQKITVRNGTVNGNFRRNHSVAKDESFSKNTFIAYMPIDTENNNSYAYSIQTNEDNIFKVVNNTSDIQAVKFNDNKIAACFYNSDKEKQSFEYSGNTYTLTNKFVDGQGAFQTFNIK